MLDRRGMMVGGAALGAGAAMAGPRPAQAQGGAGLEGLGQDGGDVTSALQSGIDAAAITGDPLRIPPGRYVVAGLALKPGVRIEGAPGRTVLAAKDAAPVITGDGANGIALFGLTFEGAGASAADARALVTLAGCDRIDIRQCAFQNAPGDGVLLRGCGGQIADSLFERCAGTSIFSHDATGLSILHNLIRDSGDNGVQIWRGEKGRDGALVASNRIERVGARSGGSGQNGNGVAVFRAGDVVVSGNAISDCAYSAIRCNSGSNIQMIGNSCIRSGENALYAEFAFDGALIASNVVDGASLGISITNFGDHGGRLAIAQGNLIRNLTGGMGTGPGIAIAVEADAMLTGNALDNAPRIGIQIGWVKSLRDVTATGNYIRGAGVGIGIQSTT
jgi:uncharacterized secreted repeat protein (TIGR03808 family)